MQLINTIAQDCISCNFCVKECPFLRENGTPGQICADFLTRSSGDYSSVFQCSLCGLCKAVCPLELDCPSAFLEIRGTLQDTGQKHRQNPSVLRKHSTICRYEALGSSPLLSLHLLPEKATSVFFPGCTLTGTRSEITLATYEYLKTITPDIGIVLDCCSKPSHDLGLNERFLKSFQRLTTSLQSKNITKIVTACPSCHATFSKYAPEFNTTTVYEMLADHPPQLPVINNTTISIHDTCTSRYNKNIQDAIRTLVRHTGAKIEEMQHRRSHAICCGEGAAASFIAPQFQDEWTALRKNEANGHRVVTYCAGCSSSLSGSIAATHLLDLLFDPKKALLHQEKVAKSPLTYINRLLLKKQLLNNKPPASPGTKRPSATVKAGLFFLTLLIAAAAARFLLFPGPADTALQFFALHLQNCPPFLYIGFFAFASVLFVPALPLVFLGGVLYGQAWGFVFTMAGATLGAGISFLSARYIGSGLFPDLQAHVGWSGIGTAMVKRNGWKLVLLLRLIPLIPFSAVNYGFGFTTIRFTHYIIATIFGILPACGFFALFSGSLSSVRHGTFTTSFYFGLAGIIVITAAPFIYRKVTSR